MEVQQNPLQENPIIKLNDDFSKLYEMTRKVGNLTEIRTEDEVNKKIIDLNNLKETLENLTNQIRNLFLEKSYNTKTKEGSILQLRRKTKNLINDIEYNIKNLDLEYLMQKKNKETEEENKLEKLFKVGAYLYYNFTICKISKVTNQKIKYKMCDSLTISIKNKKNMICIHKLQILDDDLQNFENKKEYTINKKNLSIGNFTDDDGERFSLLKHWVRHIDMGI
jgi:hypothetical protein